MTYMGYLTASCPFVVTFKFTCRMSLYMAALMWRHVNWQCCQAVITVEILLDLSVV
jgi:hypothetical protein